MILDYASQDSQSWGKNCFRRISEAGMTLLKSVEVLSTKKRKEVSAKPTNLRGEYQLAQSATIFPIPLLPERVLIIIVLANKPWPYLQTNKNLNKVNP